MSTDSLTQRFAEKQVSLPISLVLSLATLAIGGGAGTVFTASDVRAELRSTSATLDASIHQTQAQIVTTKAEILGELKLIQSALNTNSQRLADHEERIRALEARTR